MFEPTTLCLRGGISKNIRLPQFKKSNNKKYKLTVIKNIFGQ